MTKEQVGHCHLLEHCCQYLKTAAKVGSFLLQNIPWTDNSDGARSEVQVLCKLAGTILSDIKETDIGEFNFKISTIVGLKLFSSRKTVLTG